MSRRGHRNHEPHHVSNSRYDEENMSSSDESQDNDDDPSNDFDLNTSEESNALRGT